MWRVEYEIPPMIAIYHTDIHGLETEKMVISFYARQEPTWKIRKVTYLSKVND